MNSVLSLVMVFALPAAALAQDDLRREVRQLRKEIQELKKDIASLKTSLGRSGAAAPKTQGERHVLRVEAHKEGAAPARVEMWVQGPGDEKPRKVDPKEFKGEGFGGLRAFGVTPDGKARAKGVFKFHVEGKGKDGVFQFAVPHVEGAQAFKWIEELPERMKKQVEKFEWTEKIPELMKEHFQQFDWTEKLPQGTRKRIEKALPRAFEFRSERRSDRAPRSRSRGRHERLRKLLRELLEELEEDTPY